MHLIQSIKTVKGRPAAAGLARTNGDPPRNALKTQHNCNSNICNSNTTKKILALQPQPLIGLGRNVQSARILSQLNSMESTTIRVQVPKTSTQIKPLRRLAQIKFTPETVHDMKLYLTDGVLPNGSAAAQQRFRARCVGFKVLHNHLMYERGERSLEPAPGEPVVLIPVILPDEVQKTLKYFYNLETTVAKGVNQMFYFITQRCIGITRKEVNTFLHAQTTYQISFHRRNIPGRAYLCTAPLQYIAIDLVDVHYYANSNNGVTFIMSFIDLFSRFAYFVGCRGKFATATKAAFKSFIRFMHVFGPGDRYPTHVVSDNGKEFSFLANFDVGPVVF